MADTIPVPANLLAAVVDYLAEQPYKQVAGLMAGIQQAALAANQAQQPASPPTAPEPAG